MREPRTPARVWVGLEHRRIDMLMKLTFVGLDAGPSVLTDALRRSNEPWRKSTVFMPKHVERARKDLTLLYLAEVFGTTDAFYSRLTADLCFLHRHGLWPKNPEGPRSEPLPDSEVVDFDDRVAARLGLLEPASRNSIRALGFFRVLRNCGVHRLGLASSQLVELLHETDVQAGLREAARRSGTSPPPLPTFERDRRVELLPRHAVHAAAVAILVAEAFNRLVLSANAEAKLTALAARHFVLAEDPEFHSAKSSVSSRIAAAANEHYAATVSARQVRGHLEPLGLWSECSRAFERHRQRGSF